MKTSVIRPWGASHAARRILRLPARALLLAVLTCCLATALPARGAVFQENFDSYANGSQIIGQGGWVGWDNDPTVGAVVSSLYSESAPNSIRIFGTSSSSYTDLVRQFSGYTSGRWQLSASQYIPTASIGKTYVILPNNYNHNGPYNWTVQTSFDLGPANVAVDDFWGGSAVPILRDRWVDLVYDIDLTANTVSAYYNGTLFSTHVWQTGADGLNEISAIDLYSDAGPAFYDNIRLVAIPEPGAVSLLTAFGLFGVAFWVRGNRARASK
jgi:hypothetical protein